MNERKLLEEIDELKTDLKDLLTCLENADPAWEIELSKQYDRAYDELSKVEKQLAKLQKEAKKREKQNVS